MVASLRYPKTLSTLKRVLKTGESAVEGELACLEIGTGLFVAGGTSTVLFPIGYFTETLTGDGTTTTVVDLFEETKTFGWLNDSAPNNVTEAEVGSEVYIKDGNTVSTLGTGRSAAGRVLKLEGGRVFVSAGDAVTGPTGAGIGSSAAAIAAQNRFMPIPLNAFRVSDGSEIPAFVADGADGFDTALSKVCGIRWNNATDDSYEEFAVTVALPSDLDESADVVVHLQAAKVGATPGDATTFDVGAFFNVVGALVDADADAGGASSAMVGDATSKTQQHVTRTIAAANVPANTLAAPCSLTLTLKPTDDTLQTDDLILVGVVLEYTPKAAA